MSVHVFYLSLDEDLLKVGDAMVHLSLLLHHFHGLVQR